MGIFSRHGKRRSKRARKKDQHHHLADFAATRSGVEAYYEAATPTAHAAIVLVARDGEWTRRPVKNMSSALSIAEDIGVTLYEVASVGYPRQMREWSRTHRGDVR